MKELFVKIGTGDINWMGLSELCFSDRVVFLNRDFEEITNKVFNYGNYSPVCTRTQICMPDQRIFNGLSFSSIYSNDDSGDVIYLAPRISLMFNKRDLKVLEKEDTFILDANNKVLHFMYFGCTY